LVSFLINNNQRLQMNILLKIVLTSLVVLLLANILPGIAVASFGTAVWVSIAISLLNMIVRPLLVFFTLPATIVTLGLFLFVINAIIIMMAGYFVSGFIVEGFFYALLFSILLSVFRSFLFSFFKKRDQNRLN